MPIDDTEVRRIAELAHLHLEDAEVQRMRGELSRILDYIDHLARVETSGVRADSEETLTPLRPDEIGPSLPTAQVERNAPRFERGLFVVPRVIGE